MTFLRNCWYMAAWADDIPIGGILARTLLDEPVVLYRDAAGHVHALFDRCPHRFVPLSKGQVDGDALQCPYHGLAFDSSGQCVRNPHGPISKALGVRSYPIAEMHRVLWIWMGDQDHANPALIRDLSFLAQAPGTAFNKGYLCGSGNYQLFTDNVLDLSHVDYLHPDTLGGGSITRTRAKVEERTDGVIAIHWHSLNDTPTPLVAPRFPGIDRVDAWTEVEWSAPAVMKLVNGAVPSGSPWDGADTLTNVHILTPETASTTHYFFASTRNFRLDDRAFNEETRQLRARVFSTEDEPMIAAQQTRIGNNDFWSLRPALLKTDEGAVRVRRRMDALIIAEQT
ncbi:MAG: hypothetical protein JWR80_4403 [Bradyrhizobium sp.]|nr:hypothetical protein [Bradyrhizobium sp.]